MFVDQLFIFQLCGHSVTVRRFYTNGQKQDSLSQQQHDDTPPIMSTYSNLTCNESTQSLDTDSWRLDDTIVAGNNDNSSSPCLDHCLRNQNHRRLELMSRSSLATNHTLTFPCRLSPTMVSLAESPTLTNDSESCRSEQSGQYDQSLPKNPKRSSRPFLHASHLPDFRSDSDFIAKWRKDVIQPTSSPITKSLNHLSYRWPQDCAPILTPGQLASTSRLDCIIATSESTLVKSSQPNVSEMYSTQSLPAPSSGSNSEVSQLPHPLQTRILHQSCATCERQRILRLKHLETLRSKSINRLPTFSPSIWNVTYTAQCPGRFSVSPAKSSAVDVST